MPKDAASFITFIQQKLSIVKTDAMIHLPFERYEEHQDPSA
jgi:hypothetical protein